MMQQHDHFKNDKVKFGCSTLSVFAVLQTGVSFLQSNYSKSGFYNMKHFPKIVRKVRKYSVGVSSCQLYMLLDNKSDVYLGYPVKGKRL